MRKVIFHQIGHSGDTASRLERIVSLICEITAWPDWKFCPVVLQLAWPFSSLACFTRVPFWQLANCEIQSRGSSWVHTLELFFTLSHTLPLHDSHLNIGFLNAELQANLVRNKANKTLKQTLDLTCELGIVEQNSLIPNSRIWEALEPYEQVFPRNNNTIRSL